MALKTPPLTRKRKAADHCLSETSDSQGKRARNDITQDEPQDINTAPTPASELETSPSTKMDSDEDMMSAASGDELDFEEGTQASELGSGESVNT